MTKSRGCVYGVIPKLQAGSYYEALRQNDRYLLIPVEKWALIALVGADKIAGVLTLTEFRDLQYEIVK